MLFTLALDHFNCDLNLTISFAQKVALNIIKSKGRCTRSLFINIPQKEAKLNCNLWTMRKTSEGQKCKKCKLNVSGTGKGG